MQKALQEAIYGREIFRAIDKYVDETVRGWAKKDEIPGQVDVESEFECFFQDYYLSGSKNIFWTGGMLPVFLGVDGQSAVREHMVLSFESALDNLTPTERHPTLTAGERNPGGV